MTPRTFWIGLMVLCAVIGGFTAAERYVWTAVFFAVALVWRGIYEWLKWRAPQDPDITHYP